MCKEVYHILRWELEMKLGRSDRSLYFVMFIPTSWEYMLGQ